MDRVQLSGLPTKRSFEFLKRSTGEQIDCLVCAVCATVADVETTLIGFIVNDTKQISQDHAVADRLTGLQIRSTICSLMKMKFPGVRTIKISILESSFSALSTPIFATKYSFCRISIFRDLQFLHTFAPHQTYIFRFCNKCFEKIEKIIFSELSGFFKFC